MEAPERICLEMGAHAFGEGGRGERVVPPPAPGALVAFRSLAPIDQWRQSACESAPPWDFASAARFGGRPLLYLRRRVGLAGGASTLGGGSCANMI